MRHNIYYWKCDHLNRNLFKEKYEQFDQTELAKSAIRKTFGAEAESIEPMNCDGNHFAYKVRVGGKQVLFRANADDSGDDYMLAEGALTRLAAAAGVPVPALLGIDVSGAVRWQIWSWAEGRTLIDFERAGTLNKGAIARRTGEILRCLHSVSLEGFGFVDTEYLAATGNVRGLNKTYADYFHTRLEEHIEKITRPELIAPETTARMRRVFRKNAPLLALPSGKLVHRDPALWNMVGTLEDITALVDWDDAVSGDPADDFGLLHCFHDDAMVEAILAAYGPVEESFRARTALHYLRNMIWKTLIRWNMGYFEKGNGFFLNVGAEISLKDLTLGKLNQALEACEAL